MRNILMRFSLVLLSLILLPSFASAQRGGAGFGGRGRPPAAPSTEPFDSHDFNGIWWRTGGTREFNTQKGGEPQLTAEGKKRFDENKPGYGPRAGTPAIGNEPLGSFKSDGL